MRRDINSGAPPLILALTGELQSTSARMDPRVTRLLHELGRRPLDPKSTTLPKLAQLVGLSPSRFMHVFTESVKIPLRRYLRWLRVQRAVGALAGGCTVTNAAYIAGFADAAHLSRTCRRMLGTSPRELVRRMEENRELRIESMGGQFVQDNSGTVPIR
jgi:AraC-like DNA-binding protein